MEAAHNQAEDHADDARTVPLSALEAEREKRHGIERQLAELKGRVDGLSARPAPAAEQPVKTYTWTELRTSVDQGKINDTQANAIWENQQNKKITSAVEKAVQTTATQSRTQQTISSYAEKIPAVLQEGSEERARVQTEFNDLVSAGADAKSPATELAALKAAFGPLAHIADGESRRETHQEGGSGDGGGTGARKNEGSGGWPKDMPAGNRQFYQDLVNKGQQTRESAVKEWTDYQKNMSGRTRGRAA